MQAFQYDLIYYLIAELIYWHKMGMFWLVNCKQLAIGLRSTYLFYLLHKQDLIFPSLVVIMENQMFMNSLQRSLFQSSISLRTPGRLFPYKHNFLHFLKTEGKGWNKNSIWYKQWTFHLPGMNTSICTAYNLRSGSQIWFCNWRKQGSSRMVSWNVIQIIGASE